MIRKYTGTGFTIVELLVIIVVITILVSISYFMIDSWREDTANTQVENELMQAVSELEQVRNFTSSYPATGAFSTTYTPGAEVDLTYVLRSNGSFCLNGVSQAEPDVEWNVDSSVTTKPRTGSCTP